MFKDTVDVANRNNYIASTAAGFANSVFVSVYGFAGTLAQLAVLAYGIHLIGVAKLTPGLLIGYLLYVNKVYTPLRQLATVWSSFQLGTAALERISEILLLDTNTPIIGSDPIESDADVGVPQCTFPLSRR